MSTSALTPAQRRQTARTALADLGSKRAEHKQISVQCSRSHHVATVYATPAGPVYVAVTGPRAHGSRDRHDAAHHNNTHGVEQVDLLVDSRDPMVDDALPASCECGPRTLSRSELLRVIAEGKRRLRVV
jgi:hypothetical protein